MMQSISARTTKFDVKATLLGLLSLCLLGLPCLSYAADSTIQVMNGFPPKGDALVHTGNWMQAPHNSWAFKNLEKLAPSLTVDRGTLPISKLPRRRTDLHELSFNHSQGRWTLDEYLSRNHVDAMLVWQRGKLRFELYRNGQTPRTRHMMMSVTKSFTGLIAEMLLLDGQLDETTTIAKFIPELRNSAYGDASLRQVLDMEVGVKYDTSYADPNSDISQFIYAASLGAAPAGLPSYASIYDYLPTLQKQGVHGQDFHYVTPNTEVLSWVLSRVTGKPFEQLFQEMLFAPVGPERDAFFSSDRTGKAVASGGLNITARDLLRLALMIENNGRYKRKQIVAKSIIKKLMAGDEPHAAVFGNSSNNLDNSYKSQWYVHHPTQTLSAAGIYGQNVFIHQASHTVMIIQASNPAPQGAFFEKSNQLFRHLIKQ